MVLRPEYRVSVDVGCHRYSVAVGLTNGELLDEFDIDRRPEGFAGFFNRIERHQRRYPGPVAVTIEGYNGHARPLDTLVREHQWRLPNLNNLKLVRFKQVFPAAAKTDRIDARRGLELMQTGEHMPRARDVLQEVQAAPADNLELKRLTRRRRALVDEKCRVLSRLQDDLQAVCPGPLEITADAENLWWFLHLLSHGEDLTRLARLHEKTVIEPMAVPRLLHRRGRLRRPHDRRRHPTGVGSARPAGNPALPGTGCRHRT